MTRCPYCGATVEDTRAEIEHMESQHPDVIVRRLKQLGWHREAVDVERRLAKEKTCDTTD